MYSKNRGITFGGNHPLMSREPAYRQPDRPRMQVPPNYSGLAIVDGEERPLGHTEAVGIADDLSGDRSIHDAPTPRFDDLPRVSELGESRRRAHGPMLSASYEEPYGEEDQEVAAPVEQGQGIAVPAAPVSAKPALFDLSRFPFGHGIGFEEILLLGLIFFLLRENADCEDRFDRGDLDETVILLGLLLLLG